MPVPKSSTWPSADSARTVTREAAGRWCHEIGGPMPVNTDGGLIANGEPIGASGLRQIHEIVRQLRGEAGERQVPGNPKVGFTQLYGAPGTAAATILTT